MNEHEKQEMIETVRERVGFEQDTPDNDEYWEWYENVLDPSIKEKLDEMIDYTILTTQKYIEEKSK